MARTAAIAVENNFSQGLVTEATGLNFPENAATELWDCKVNIDGSVERRKGIDYENGYALKNIDRDSAAIHSYMWENVGGDGSLSLSVLQVGGTLYFYRTTELALSDGIIADTVTLSTYAPAGAPSAALNRCQFATGDGHLFVSHDNLEPFYISYNPATEAITETQIDVKIRDHDGLATSAAVDFRPTATKAGLDDTQEYNLRNQGWGFNSDAALDSWDTAQTTMPSNADVWWLFKTTADVFDSTLIDRYDRGTTPAPKGHFVLDAFLQDRDAASGMSGIADVTSGTQRPCCIAFFAGRVWYAGTKYDGFSSKVYFSQVATSTSKYGLCHMEADPTSETLFDIKADDGGVVEIQSIGTVKLLLPFTKFLLVFANNGIWAISGSDGAGFSATNFSITRVSDIGIINAHSLVEAEGRLFWWGDSGIYLMEVGPLDSLAVNPLTIENIDTFYKSVPEISKSFAEGQYNIADKTIYWLYKSTTGNEDTVDKFYEYDRLLTFNLAKQSFWPWTIGSSDVKVMDILTVKGSTTTQVEALDVWDVTGGNDDVLDNTGADDVQSTQLTNPVTQTVIKFVTSVTDGAGSYNFTFAEEYDFSYTDFETHEGVGSGIDYSSYIITGYKVHGDGLKRFNSNYLRVFTETTPNSSLFVQLITDYGNDALSKRFSTAQQCYPARDYRDVQHKRLKMRGSGIVQQYKFYSESGKPFKLIGWSAFETSNGGP